MNAKAFVTTILTLFTNSVPSSVEELFEAGGYTWSDFNITPSDVLMQIYFPVLTEEAVSANLGGARYILASAFADALLPSNPNAIIGVLNADLQSLDAATLFSLLSVKDTTGEGQAVVPADTNSSKPALDETPS